MSNFVLPRLLFNILNVSFSRLIASTVTLRERLRTQKKNSQNTSVFT